MKRSMRELSIGAVLASVPPFVGALPMTAQENTEPLASCSNAVGTFMTQDGARTSAEISRSLVSFASDGNAYFVDANQDGLPGYAPYGSMQGAWRCVAVDGSAETIRVTWFHFTKVSPSFPTQQIGRVDVEATIDGESLSGNLMLRLLPIDANPDAHVSHEGALSGEITGQKVVVR